MTAVSHITISPTSSYLAHLTPVHTTPSPAHTVLDASNHGRPLIVYPNGISFLSEWHVALIYKAILYHFSRQYGLLTHIPYVPSVISNSFKSWSPSAMLATPVTIFQAGVARGSNIRYRARSVIFETVLFLHPATPYDWHRTCENIPLCSSHLITPSYGILLQPWSSLINHVHTHVILVSVACGPTYRARPFCNILL